MASSYDNDLRLNEMATGDQSGAWGTVTNLNLEIIAEAFGYGTRAIANASTDNITIADGALDADRSMYLKLTGGGQACTVSLLPNTVSKVWLIENATSYTLTFTQGSGANVAVLAGQVKMIATDGAGSGAVVYDLLTDVNLAGTTVMGDIAVGGKVITMTGSSGDTATLTVAADGALAIATTDAAAAAANISITADGTFTATGTTITLDSAGDIILDADGADVIFKDGGTSIGTITNASSDLVIKSNVQDKDILLKGDDGGTEITALSLDMSAGGNALFSGTVTRDLTRGSIDVGNSSGVSTPLAKGAAGTVLTSDGTDLSFVAASGGGEATFTATGAITAGNVVGFNANGTISVMPQFVGSGVSLGSGAGSGVVGRQPMAYDTANDKYLHVFQGTNTKLFARVGTVSSNFGLSFGTAVDSGITLSSFVAQRGCLHLVYDDNAGKFVVSYIKSDNKGYASTITISGTTPSFGTEINVYTGTSYHSELGYDSNANKVLFLNAGNQDSVRGRVGTISGTNISLGSEVNFGNYPVNPQPGSLSFDTSANKFIYIYAVGSTGQPLNAMTMTISGTSVSGGSVITLTNSMPSNRTANSVYDPSINKTVAVYVNGFTPVFKLLTISGTSISAGTETTIPFTTTPAYQAYVQNHVQIVVDPDNNGLIFAYSTVNSSNEPGGTCVTPGTFSGSTLTLGVEIRVSETAGLAGLIYDPDTDQTVIGTSALGVADSAVDQVVNAGAGVRPAYVGIAAENISNGATGKVTIIGGVNANQSSLSAGTQYGIPTTSASLVATDIKPVGIAISSTKIYLRAALL